MFVIKADTPGETLEEVLALLRQQADRHEADEQDAKTKMEKGRCAARRFAITSVIDILENTAVTGRRPRTEDWSSDVTKRLERIERRLDLGEPGQ